MHEDQVVIEDRRVGVHLAPHPVGLDELVVTTRTDSAVERKVALPPLWLRGFASAQALAASFEPRVDVDATSAAVNTIDVCSEANAAILEGAPECLNSLWADRLAAFKTIAAQASCGELSFPANVEASVRLQQALMDPDCHADVATRLIQAGAEKVSLNSAAVRDPDLIAQVHKNTGNVKGFGQR